MKNFTVITALFAVMLISACDTLVRSEPRSLEAGRGTVQVTLPGDGESGRNGRTVLPLFSDLSYTLVFSSEDFSDVTHTVTGGGEFILDQGIWNLTVEALESDTPIARGSAGPIFVLPGKTVTAKVTLNPLGVEDGTGSLNYTVNFPTDTETGALKLISFPGGAVVVEEDILAKPSSVIEDIPVGYYQLILSLAKDGDTQVAGKSDIVHIYRDQSSKFEWTLDDEDFADKRTYFFSFDEMQYYLELQSPNSEENPIKVKLAVGAENLSLASLCGALAGKYVEVDLSDSSCDSVSGSVTSSNGSIVKLVLPSRLTRINDNAFANANNMEIVFPASLKEIGDSAFSSSSIKVFDFSGTALEKIGVSAFNNCNSITSLVIPRSLKGFAKLPYTPATGTQPEAGTPRFANPFPAGIAFDAISFSGEGPLRIETEDFGRGNSIQYWISSEESSDETLFYIRIKGTASAINTIAIPQGVTKIVDGLFYYNSRNPASSIKLSEVTLPDSLEHLGAFQFMGQPEITALTLPRGLKTIGRGAFRSCEKLEFLNIADTQLESIESFAFYTGSSEGRLWRRVPGAAVDNSVVVFPATLKTIDQYAFGHHYFFNNSAKLTKADFSQTQLTSIGVRAFAYCKQLEAVMFPDTLTSIGEEAFFHSPIEMVNFPPSLESLGYRAFSAATAAGGDQLALINRKLTTVDLSRTKLTTLPRAFDYCVAVTTVLLPPSLKHIEDYAFSSVGNITTFAIPEGSQLESIGSNVFNVTYNVNAGTVVNTGITSLNFPASLKTLKNNALAGLSGLTSLTIPASLETIGTNVFSGCAALQEITVSGVGSLTTDSAKCMLIKDNVVFIALPSSAGSVTVPEGVTEIGANAFQDCAGITALTFPVSLQSIGTYAFRGCTGITAPINFPEDSSLFNIGNYAFYNCTAIPSMDFSNTKLETVGNTVFYNVNALTSVVFPATVTTFGNTTFIKTPASTLAITLKSVSPPVVGSNFISAQLLSAGTANGVYIYVPSGSVNAYKDSTSPNWSTYAAVITATTP
jgi:hypothetical protein